MCGIAGFIGSEKISKSKIFNTLELMKNRGPDNQSYKQITINHDNNVTFLHSRLSIIDLKNRSNQPFKIGSDEIVFNGEIYNYIELRNHLKEKGVKFKTSSDTEVLLKFYKIYGAKCLNFFEGMWSFVIYDFDKKSLFVARDRFGEKPLYYYKNSRGLFFGSEIKFIKKLSDTNFQINEKKINEFLTFGYKNLEKKNYGFFKGPKEIEPGECAYIDLNGNIKKSRYWVPSIKIKKKMSIDDAILNTKEKLIKSIKLRTRSDVPVAITLGGGIDSSSIVSISKKILNLKTKTFSIIDSDSRYNELKNISLINKDTESDHKYIYLNKNKNSEKNILRLQKLIKYNEKPLCTISYFVHSFIMEQIKKDKYKVSLQGTGADEMFGGYYDHHLLYLESIKNDKKQYLREKLIFKKDIKPQIRNPILKREDLFLKNRNYREHVYDNFSKNSEYLIKPVKFNFKEKHFHSNLMKNRMLNEIFFETTKVILREDDLISMKQSIENRSPYLDLDLFNHSYSIPNKFLIKNGMKKHILRESMRGIVHDNILNDNKKVGYNASISSLFNLNNMETKEMLLNKKSNIFNFVDRNKISKLLETNKLSDHMNKFLFNFINCKIFIDSFEG